MTLRTSIILSLALHVLLFGAGVAIARRADLMSGKGQRSIMVSLVAMEDSKNAPGQTRTPVQARREPVMPPRGNTAMADLARANAAPVHVTPAESIGSADAGSQADTGMTQLPEGQAGADQPSVSSEQWTVIVSSIEKVKTYPRLARMNGIEGVVRLRFRVRPQGDVERVEIVASSGSDILDKASVKTVYRAGPLPYVNGWVEVPIAYVLQ